MRTALCFGFETASRRARTSRWLRNRRELSLAFGARQIELAQRVAEYARVQELERADGLARVAVGHRPLAEEVEEKAAGVGRVELRGLARCTGQEAARVPQIHLPGLRAVPPEFQLLRHPLERGASPGSALERLGIGQAGVSPGDRALCRLGLGQPGVQEHVHTPPPEELEEQRDGDGGVGHAPPLVPRVPLAAWTPPDRRHELGRVREADDQPPVLAGQDLDGVASRPCHGATPGGRDSERAQERSVSTVGGTDPHPPA